MKQRLHNAVLARAGGVKASGTSLRNRIVGGAVTLGVALAPVAAHAQTTGSGGTQTYGLGQAGSPAASDYFAAAQGFNSSTAPLLTAILPVLVVILAIWQGPKLIKRLTTMMAH